MGRQLEDWEVTIDTREVEHQHNEVVLEGILAFQKSFCLRDPLTDGPVIAPGDLDSTIGLNATEDTHLIEPGG
jgi:hypothetical protein